MELKYIVSACRRSWWAFVLLPALLVGLVSLRAGRAEATRYTATTSLVIAPPGPTFGANVNPADPDRYVITQVSALSNPSLIDQGLALAAERAGGDVVADFKVSHQIRTDLVYVTATGPDPEDVVVAANALVETYLDEQRKALGGDVKPAIKQVKERLATLKEELTDAERAVFASPGNAEVKINRDLKIRDYEQFLRTLADLEFNRRNDQVNSFVVDSARASRPVASTSKSLLLTTAVLGGLALAGAFSVIRAWASSSVRDSAEVEEILGLQVATTLPKLRRFPTDRRAQLSAAPRQYTSAVTEVAVRVEGVLAGSRTGVVTVVGLSRGTGVSTLALSIGRALTRPGSETIVVDADERTERLSADLGVSSQQDVSGLVRLSEGPARSDAFSKLLIELRDGLRFLGGAAAFLNRATVGSVMTLARDEANAVVLDSGVLFHSPTSIHMCRAADVIVLVIPAGGIQSARLDAAMRQLDGIAVVPVMSRIHRASAARNERPALHAAASRSHQHPDDRVPLASGPSLARGGAGRR